MTLIALSETTHGRVIGAFDMGCAEVSSAVGLGSVVSLWLLE